MAFFVGPHKIAFISPLLIHDNTLSESVTILFAKTTFYMYMMAEKGVPKAI